MENYVLITGASSGIGRDIAVTLSKTYPLILGGRNVERLEETRAMCTDSDKHIFWNYDLADVENIYDNLTAFIKNNELKVGGFVHSAGIWFVTTLNLVKLNDVQKMMNINFLSAVEILRSLVKRKTNAKNLKDVILVSSIAPFKSAKGEAFYAASKAAINVFARAMADELAPNTRVNTINPGIIHTPMMDNLLRDNEQFEKHKRTYLLGFGETEDVANMAEFLMSDKARRITGQHFVVDGGATIAI
ncbi:MAG: SDR family oxidoreductase [Selenomonadaceae bacterium]|nr:SDR family oxidoreductase [Selenomonadaceae bacterium]